MSFSSGSILGTESEAQFLSRFWVGLREDLRTKLLAHGVTELEKAYTLVQDLDAVRSNHAFRSQDQELKKCDPSIIPIAREVVESNSTIFPEVTPVIKEFSDIIQKDLPDKLPLMRDIQHAIESDSEEFIYYVDKVGDNFDNDHESEDQMDEVDDFKDDHEGEDVVFNCIRQAPLTHLSVDKSAFSQSEEKED